MADFCKQCSTALFGVDSRDLAELISKEDAEKGFSTSTVLCEGCGPIQVNYEGACISPDCIEAGHHVPHTWPQGDSNATRS